MKHDTDTPDVLTRRTALLQAGIEASETPLILLDEQKIILAASQAACATLGVGLQALLGHPITETGSNVLHQRDLTAIEAPKLTLLRVGPERLLATSSVKLTDGAQQPIGWLIRLHEASSGQTTATRDRLPFAQLTQYYHQRMSATLGSMNSGAVTPAEAQRTLSLAAEDLAGQGQRMALLQTLSLPQPPPQAVVDLAALTQALSTHAEAIAGQRGVVFERSGMIEALQTRGHEELIRLALTELLDNVWQHASGCTRVRLGLASDQQTVQLLVQDDGVGLPTTDYVRLARWLDDETAPSGTIPRVGLGLALVRAVARVHGGFMRIQSRPGRGCRVTLILSTTETPVFTAANAFGKSLATILVIEDDDVIREIASRTLRTMGYQVIAAADGIDGVELARSQHPDLILLDMGLPRRDGWDITADLKANAATHDIPIIALTAHTHPNDRVRALDAGCADYETKPVHFPRLLGKIDGLLGQ